VTNSPAPMEPGWLHQLCVVGRKCSDPVKFCVVMGDSS